jgi:Uma2 family endonuclease
MSVSVRKPMTMDEFLAWEERQELRYEFDGFAPVAMTGGSMEHSAIERNLITALTNRLRGKTCQVFTSNLKVQAAGSIRYPDAFVVCSPQARRTMVVSDPVVVFEILSPSTATVDGGVKNAEYRDTPSIQRYVMLYQDRQQATVFERTANDWVGHIFIGDAVLAMPEIDIEVPMAELYDGVTFDPTEEAVTD